MAGQSPDIFWRQTPASFDAVMRGALKREQMRADADLSLAYTTAAFNAAARAGKLKSLSHYRNKTKPQGVRQTPQEMLEALKAFKARGVPMKITRFERKPK